MLFSAVFVYLVASFQLTFFKEKAAGEFSGSFDA